MITNKGAHISSNNENLNNADMNLLNNLIETEVLKYFQYNVGSGAQQITSELRDKKDKEIKSRNRKHKIHTWCALIIAAIVVTAGVYGYQKISHYNNQKSFDEAIITFNNYTLFEKKMQVGQSLKPCVWSNVVCYSSDESVVTVSKTGVVTAKHSGTAYVVIKDNLNNFFGLGDMYMCYYFEIP